MATPLTLLIVEDSVEDAELLVRALQREGFAPQWKRVETETAFLAELSKVPDLVLSDYSMPQFSGLRAAQLTQESGLDVPFILISGTVGEDVAVEAMKRGATDYLLKDRIGRLGSAVQRALAQHRLQAERKHAEQLIRLQASALDAAANAIVVTDIRGIILSANTAFCSMTGYTAEEVIGHNPRMLNSGQHDPEIYRTMWNTALAGAVWRGELTNRRKDGTLYPEEMTITPVRATDGAGGGRGEVAYFIAVKQDITERRRKEEELRSTNVKLNQVLSHTPAVIYTVKLEGSTVTPMFVSENVERLLGFSVTEATNYEWWLGRLHPEDRERVLALVATELKREGYSAEYRLRHKDGSYRWVQDNSRVVRDGAGQPTESVGLWTDITERKQLEAEVAFREQQLNAFFTGATAGLALLDKELRFLQINDTLANMNGVPAKEHLGRTLQEVVPKLAPVLVPHVQRVLTTGEPVLDVELSGETPRQPGIHRHWIGSYFPMGGHAASPMGVGGIVVEITGRKQAEAELQWKTAFLEAQVNSSLDGILVVSGEGKQILQNQRMAQLWKMPPEIANDPDDRKQLQFVMGKVKDPEGFIEKVHYLYAHRDEVSRDELELCDGTILDRYSSPVLGKDGTYYGRIWTFRDITEQRHLEAQLRQSQKLEGIGQLAGGVAHDFNNLLAVIRGNAELALMDGDSFKPESVECLKDVIGASESAANLTRQLLIFSRKQLMQFQAVGLNYLVENLTKMLKRIIREDIRLDCIYSPELPCVEADPGMLEQVLLNLVVNARDAMPDGGQIQIQTETLTPVSPQLQPEARGSQFVCLSVTDTGTGILPEHLPLIFDPFYTTKEPGKGTGLGLATVYGIVKQHRGWVEVSSQVGTGTTFKVFLPALPPTTAPGNAQRADPVLRGGTETLLLVEDDDQVRNVTRRVLENYGYKICEASCAQEALETWRRLAGEIALLLSDIVMPGGVTGRDLAQTLRAEKPGLKVIFMSGYSAEVLGKDTDFFRRTKSHFLRKPSSTSDLVMTVRQCLDE